MNWLDKIRRAPEGLARAQGDMADVMIRITDLHRKSVREAVETVNPYAVDAIDKSDERLTAAVEIASAHLQEQAQGFVKAIWYAATMAAIKDIAARQGGTQAEQGRWAVEQMEALMPDLKGGDA